MVDLYREIAKANDVEIEGLLKTVLRRYSTLLSDWEISVISAGKNKDKNEQLDRKIALLEKMRTKS